MSCVDVAFHNGIKLQYTKPLSLCCFDAVLNKLFSDMFPSAFTAYGKAGIADVSAPADIIRVQNI